MRAITVFMVPFSLSLLWHYKNAFNIIIIAISIGIALGIMLVLPPSCSNSNRTISIVIVVRLITPHSNNCTIVVNDVGQ